MLTCGNAVVAALATYRGMEFTDSVPFCGKVCHTVMQPEYAAYQDSPHAGVACVECHIGSLPVRTLEAVGYPGGVRRHLQYV